MRFPRGRLRFGSISARPADESSLPEVEACVAAAHDYFRRAEGALAPAVIAADRLADALADANRRLFVLHVDGAPAGLLELALDTPRRNQCTLVLLVFSQSLRGRGLGRELVTSLLELLAACHCSRLCLGVAPGERGAAAFWTEMGLWPAGKEGCVQLFELPLAPAPAARRAALG